MRLAALLLLFGAAGFAGGGPSGSDKRAANEMMQGTLYLRTDIPCIRGSKGCSIWAAPLTEVSPADYSVTGNAAARDGRRGPRGFIGGAGMQVGTPYWGFGPNDTVRRYRLIWFGDSVVVWVKGLSPGQGLLPLLFYGIGNLDNFTAAFNRVFAKVPLHDEHPEWPAEIRKAIAERRVVEGMTKRQAFCVVGLPITTRTGTENGTEVEVWFPRQESGALEGFAKPAATGFPAVLRFAGGKLVKIDTSKSEELKLD